MSYSNSLQYRSLQRVNAMIDREDQEKKEICDFLVRVYRSLYVRTTTNETRPTNQSQRICTACTSTISLQPSCFLSNVVIVRNSRDKVTPATK